MDRPSFDHANESIFPPWTVRGQASPPAGEISQICRGSGLSSASGAARGSRSVRNAIQRPSGDHCGLLLAFLPRVSWTLRPDPTSATKICVGYAFSFQSVSCRSYATKRPSGEICGLRTLMSESDWSRVGGAAPSPAGRRRAGTRRRTARTPRIMSRPPLVIPGAAALECLTHPIEEDVMSLRIGDEAPNFKAETTQGPIDFHQWIGDGYAILFSHPKDFTPVCTTELGTMARMKSDFDKRNTKIIGLSVDPVNDHERWAKDIEETQGTA